MDNRSEVREFLASRRAKITPYDRDPTDLVGELSTRSEECATLWAVTRHEAGESTAETTCVETIPVRSAQARTEW